MALGIIGKKQTCSDDIRRRPLSLFFHSIKIETKALSCSLHVVI